MAYAPTGYSQMKKDIKRRSTPAPPKFLKPLLSKKVTHAASDMKKFPPDHISYYDEEEQNRNNPYRQHRPRPVVPEGSTVMSPAESTMSVKTRNNTLPPGLLAAAMSSSKQRCNSPPNTRISNSQKRLESLIGGGLTSYLQSVEKKRSIHDDEDNTLSLFSSSVIDSASHSISFPTDQNSRMKSLRLASKSLLLDAKTSSRHKLHTLPKNLLLE